MGGAGGSRRTLIFGYSHVQAMMKRFRVSGVVPRKLEDLGFRP
jgi:hypothetical protein